MQSPTVVVPPFGDATERARSASLLPASSSAPEAVRCPRTARTSSSAGSASTSIVDTCQSAGLSLGVPGRWYGVSTSDGTRTASNRREPTRLRMLAATGPTADLGAPASLALLLPIEAGVLAVGAARARRCDRRPPCD